MRRTAEREDAVQYKNLLLAEIGVKPGQVRELQNVPMERLLAADAQVRSRLPAPSSLRTGLIRGIR